MKALRDSVSKKKDYILADMEFGKLGYRFTHTQWGGLKYYKDDENVFIFDIKRKGFYKSGEYDGMCDCITMQELQAINEKCKELGWLND